MKVSIDAEKLSKDVSVARNQAYEYTRKIEVDDVLVEMNGNKKILKLQIGENLRKSKDIETIEKNIVSAINKLNLEINIFVSKKLSEPFENMVFIKK